MLAQTWQIIIKLKLTNHLKLDLVPILGFQYETSIGNPYILAYWVKLVKPI